MKLTLVLERKPETQVEYLYQHFKHTTTNMTKAMIEVLLDWWKDFPLSGEEITEAANEIEVF